MIGLLHTIMYHTKLQNSISKLDTKFYLSEWIIFALIVAVVAIGIVALCVATGGWPIRWHASWNGMWITCGA